MELLVWHLRKNGHDAKCIVRSLADTFEVAVMIDGMRLQPKPCVLQADAKRWGLAERSTWTLHGWEAVS